MRKLNYLFCLLAVPAMLTFTGCGSDDDTPPEPCESATFPSTTGTATVAIKNFTTDNNSDGIIDVNARAGDFLSFAVEITKGNDRTKKLRVYQTDCINQLGTVVSFQGQPNAQDGGKRIDLRNTDEAQIRTLNYTVPTGFSTLYLNFEVEEASGKLTYKRVKLNISNSGIVDQFSGLVLGGNSNSNGSRLISSTGQVLKACNAAANIDYVDVTYAVSTVAPTYYSYISSNPARTATPLSLSVSSADCGAEDGTLSTDGGKATYFKKNTTVDFEAADAAVIDALTIANTDPQYVRVTAANEVFEFLNSDGKKGLVKVTAVDPTYGLNDGRGSITVSVKVQR